jgi:hypothetical protein
MRRKHWWGATLGAGVVAGAAFLAPAALAVPVAQSHPASWSGNNSGFNGAQGNGYENQHHKGKGHKDDGCHYPPHAKPEVALKDGSVKHNKIKVSGSAKLNRCGYAHKKVFLYQHKGHHWDKVAETTTNDAGDFGFAYRANGKTDGKGIVVKAAVEGSDGIKSAQSDPLKLSQHEYR